ncbi:IS5 family transposase [Aromatoleum buckelii]|nr:IS5 family transposase [Aromatoleum buckelii]
MPREFCDWHSTYVRFARWRDAGVWDRVSQALVGDFELERVFIDATIVRAPARRRRPKKVDPQAFGRSRGGLSTKLHFAVDALGNPLRLMLTAGQIADIDCAQDLVANSRCGALIADKGYDANALVEAIEASAQTAIPLRSNRITPCRWNGFGTASRPRS